MIFYESNFELSNEAVVKYAKEISEVYEKEAKKRVGKILSQSDGHGTFGEWNGLRESAGQLCIVYL